MSDWVGRTLSKVEVQKLLGRGGMAEVYMGRHTTLNRQVAVKLLHSHFSEDEMLLGRFRSEAQAVAGMRHPNIVQVFDFDVAEDRPYIVMEFVDGPSLKEYIQTQRQADRVMSPRTVSRLLAEIASALDYAHSRGIIHRDVKPANVLLRHEAGPVMLDEPLPDDAEAVLTDFGVARMANASVQTASGVIVGTPAYMAPEQIRGEPVDARTDIYSLGVMLYEMLSGQLPFDAETQASILIQHMTEPPPPLSHLGPEIEQVVDRVLAKLPEDRYQTAGDLAQAFTQAVARSENLSDASYATLPSPIPLHSDASTIGRSPTASRSRPSDTVNLAGEATQIAPAHSALPVWAMAGGGGLILVVAVAALIVALGGRKPPAVGTGSEATATMAVVQSTQPITVADQPTATEVLPTPEPTVDVTTPHGEVTYHDAGLDVTLTGLDAPPDGSEYRAWLIGGEPAPLDLGAVDVQAGQASLSYTDPGGLLLLTQYDLFELTVEPQGSDEATPSGSAAYTAQLDSDVLARVQALYTYSAQRDQPFKTALLSGLGVQATQYDSHLGYAIDSLNSSNLPDGKRHSEHVINIVSGVESPDYGDWDGSGRAENPGDDVGLEPYLMLLQDAARSAAEAPNATDADRQASDAVIQAADAVLQTVDDAKRQAMRLTSVELAGGGAADQGYA